MKFNYLCLLILSLVVAVSCGSNRHSMIMVGEDRAYANHAVGVLSRYANTLSDSIALVDKVDTLGYSYDLNGSPFSSLMFYRDSICYYQEISISCSPCADYFLKQILNDRRYNFEAVDAVNYLSNSKKIKVVMRLSDGEVDGESCSKIKVNMIQN